MTRSFDVSHTDLSASGAWPLWSWVSDGMRELCPQFGQELAEVSGGLSMAFADGNHIHKSRTRILEGEFSWLTVPPVRKSRNPSRCESRRADTLPCPTVRQIPSSKRTHSRNLDQCTESASPPRIRGKLSCCQFLVGEMLSDYRHYERIQPLQGVTAYIANVQAERELIHIAMQMLLGNLKTTCISVSCCMGAE